MTPGAGREADLIFALRSLAVYDLGEPFGEDAGLCWCDPFYRGTEWPGHDELCSFIRQRLGEPSTGGVS